MTNVLGGRTVESMIWAPAFGGEPQKLHSLTDRFVYAPKGVSMSRNLSILCRENIPLSILSDLQVA
jgi:hypothetical protein